MCRPSVLQITGVGLLLFAAWVLVDGSIQAHEILIGILSSALASCFVLHVVRHEELHLHFRWKDIAQARYIPGAIFARSWQITVLLLKDLLGHSVGSFYRKCGFRGGTHNPQALERTVLATLYTTVAPNFIVIGIDPAQSLMLFHQIERSEVSTMTKALGAQQ